MPAKKRSINPKQHRNIITQKPRKQSMSIQDEMCSSSNFQCANSTCGMQSKRSHIDFIKTEIQEKYEEDVQLLKSKLEYMISQVDLELRSLILTLPEDLLNMPIDFNDENFRSQIIECMTDYEKCKNGVKICANNTSTPTKYYTGIKKRRSKSAGSFRTSRCLAKGTGSGRRIRSSSMDALEFQTPVSKVRLSTLTTATKYTVSKVRKMENNGISVKRIMKPGEEVISITGSPLFVQPNITTQPTVNIPLPGGVVMNIEPKKQKGQITVPELDGLDVRTKEQLKILCQQLTNIFAQESDN